MNFEEVKNSFFEYEEKRHQKLQETQKYFLENKIQPYVWFDEQHQLRIKHKYIRGTIENFSLNDNNEERSRFYKIVENFCKQNDLKIRFIFDFCETDTNLPEDRQSQWSTEFILEV